MTPSEESYPPDRPFPGAHSQVPGAVTESAEVSRTSAAPRRLPLDAAPAPAGQGWVIRLRVRAEQVAVTKQVVVRERVVLRRRQVGDIAHLDTTVQREQLRLEAEGQVEAT